jgi:hypothetical protein
MSTASRITVSYDTSAWHPADFPIGVAVSEGWIHDPDLHCEAVDLGQIATGSVKESAAF